MTNSTSDFKSRSNDIFDKLTSLEKQHDTHTKTTTPLLKPDDETPAPSLQNPSIPTHAITFKKRPADDTFTRPQEKWKKYDLHDVNEHHLSATGNRHALNDFLRTRVKTPNTTETSTDEKEETPLRPIFKRPLKKEIQLHDNDDDKNDHFLSVRVPKVSSTNETKTDNDNDDEPVEYKLPSSRKKPRGVFSKNEKQPIKTSNDILQEKDSGDDAKQDQDANDDDDEDVDDEFFEP